MARVYLRHKFCKRGHDKELVGLTKSGGCKTCHAIVSRRNARVRVLERRVIQWRARGINYSLRAFKELDAKQKGFCAVCRRHQAQFKYKLALDHNHKTGVVRGLLCMNCNRNIVPLVENKSSLLEAAARYLEKHND